MRNIAEIKLNYVSNNGEDKTIDFKIGFISNRMIRDYKTIQETVQKVSMSWLKLNQIKDESSAVTDKNKLDKLMNDIEIETENIKSIGNEDFFKLRFNLIKRILMRNGYSDTKQFYLKFKFWDENVEPDETLRFLANCIQKDMINNKKKSPKE